MHSAGLVSRAPERQDEESLNLRQLLGCNQRIILLDEAPTVRPVVKTTAVCLGVTMQTTEVPTAPKT